MGPATLCFIVLVGTKLLRNLVIPHFFFAFFALFVFLHCFCVVLVDTKLLRNLVIRFLFFAVLDCSRGRQVVTKFATTAKETYIYAAKETCIYAAKETYLYRKRDLH